MGHFGEPVHYNEDCVICAGAGQLCDEVYRDVLPGGLGGLEGKE